MRRARKWGVNDSKMGEKNREMVKEKMLNVGLRGV